MLFRFSAGPDERSSPLFRALPPPPASSNHPLDADCHRLKVALHKLIDEQLIRIDSFKLFSTTSSTKPHFDASVAAASTAEGTVQTTTAPMDVHAWIDQYEFIDGNDKCNIQQSLKIALNVSEHLQQHQQHQQPQSQSQSSLKPTLVFVTNNAEDSDLQLLKQLLRDAASSSSSSSSYVTSLPFRLRVISFNAINRGVVGRLRALASEFGADFHAHEDATLALEGTGSGVDEVEEETAPEVVNEEAYLIWEETQVRPCKYSEL